MNNKKMQWLIDRCIKGECDYLLANTGKNKGTIVIPTGGGKSGIVYEDIIWHIKNNYDGQKIIFNLSAPILKLEAQFLNDFISVAKEVLSSEINSGKFMFFVNSSADGNDYNIEQMNCDANKFSDIDMFEKSDVAKFAFVASCHKSLYKFAEKIDYLKSFSRIVTYIDEAHLVVDDTRDDKKYSQLSTEGKINFDAVVECCKSDYLYAMTATPDVEVTKKINTIANEESDYHIVDKPARELIAENVILSPRVLTRRVGDGTSEKVTPTVCSEFMNGVKEDNPNMVHKILVTCHNTDHLNALQDSLKKLGYKVFSTCSREGGKMYDTDTDEFKYIDEVSFINEVDGYNGDCFVLHIKQLTQGIDIKTLTGCIYYNSTRLNNGVKRTIIQTVGRTLRPAIGERGKLEEERTKKYAYVLFLIGDNDFDAVCRQTINFIVKYYGRDGIKSFTYDTNNDYGNVGKVKVNFWGGNSHLGDDIYDIFEANIEALKVSMKKYVETNVKPKVEALAKLGNGAVTKRLIDMTISEMRRKYDGYVIDMSENFNHYDGEYDTNEVLTDIDLMRLINEMCKVFNVE